jgi:hypothetical protein
MFVPAIWSHQPNAGIGLRIKIDNQHLFFMQLRESSSNVYDRCGLSDPSLKIDESEDF